ncbi:FAD-dependent oxidoreductase [Gordonia polyisoprenivorans]|uniref:NAD(P)/FAD-dependent oxidoreductase n=1 Tax=Gordonia polyisoprenivorans TaxID=84595 RepID=UPI001B8D48B8|nr:FAD-dependent oxidoreductase [Gordonia polyisoprenivorans]QUD84736.1 FAD-dependent oxidoreductase [Gordonia polyisoprenivorans]
MSEQRRVMVVGGGYAGTMAANRLAAESSFDVVMVNARDHFVERIRLHQWAAGTATPTRDFETLLSARVRRIVATAEHIDAPGRQVGLDSGDRLDYDWLIYAVGSSGSAAIGSAAIEGAADHAQQVTDWESATRLRNRLAELRGTGRVTVVGGGLTGIETAAELAEAGHRVTLVTADEIASSLSVRGRERTRRALEHLGVVCHEHTRVERIGATTVTLVHATGEWVEAATDITVVTTGFAVPDLARRSGLTCDHLGRLCTDAALVSVDDERILGAGDAVAPPGNVPRMSCQAAMPLGVAAAQSVRALAKGEHPVAAYPGFVAQCVSLGRHTATLQLTHKDDSPTRGVVTGRGAALMKELVCRGTIWGLQLEARHPGIYPAARSTASVDHRDPTPNGQVVL